jgi:hypothetical protein
LDKILTWWKTIMVYPSCSLITTSTETTFRCHRTSVIPRSMNFRLLPWSCSFIAQQNSCIPFRNNLACLLTLEPQ